MSHDADSSARPTNGPCRGDTELPHSTTKSIPTTSTAEASTELPQRPASSTSRILPTPIATAPSLTRRVSTAATVTVPNLTPRVFTATASSPGDTSAHSSPVGGGPTSTSYVVPPRPKPGRKPATDEPASKRKAQNRESQRAFRARKAAKLCEMQRQVELADSKYKNEINEMHALVHERDLRIKELEAKLAQLQETESRLIRECDYWKSRVSNDQTQIQQIEQQLRDQPNPLLADLGPNSDLVFSAPLPDAHHNSPAHGSGSISSLTDYNTPPTAPDIGGCSNCSIGGQCQCLEELAKLSPMDNVNPWMATGPLIPTPGQSSHSPVTQSPVPGMDIYADREIDFTAQFASKQPHQHDRQSIAFLMEGTEDHHPNCGFCTDVTNCVCRGKPLQQSEFQQHVDGVVPASSVARPTNGAVDGPGSCADCQTNPQQRAWCQRVAQLRNPSHDVAVSPTSCNPSSGNMPETMEPQLKDPYVSKPSISCNEAFKLFEGRVPMDQDKMDWISQLRPISHERRDTFFQSPFRKYSALELDTAGVIATLGNTMQPIQPRASDGENAALVRMAQQQQIQKHAQSPQDQLTPQFHMGTLVDAVTRPMNWQ